MPPGRDYPATLVRIIDGDTCVLDVHLGFGVTLQRTVRLAGIDAPELGTSTAAALAAAAFLDAAQRRLAGDPLTLRTYTDAHGADKEDRYGRTLADLYTPDGTHLNAELVRRHLASPTDTPETRLLHPLA